MGYNAMYGAGSGGMFIFGFLFYILVLTLMILGIAALWKYLNKK